MEIQGRFLYLCCLGDWSVSWMGLRQTAQVEIYQVSMYQQLSLKRLVSIWHILVLPFALEYGASMSFHGPVWYFKFSLLPKNYSHVEFKHLGPIYSYSFNQVMFVNTPIYCALCTCSRGIRFNV